MKVETHHAAYAEKNSLFHNWKPVVIVTDLYAKRIARGQNELVEGMCVHDVKLQEQNKYKGKEGEYS